MAVIAVLVIVVMVMAVNVRPAVGMRVFDAV
jgi:hypothetical protein